MKYLIIGLHASGKHDVMGHLRGMGVKCGRQFLSGEDTKDPYYTFEHEVFDVTEVTRIFENNAYIFLQERPGYQLSINKAFEGLTQYEFDNNEVFVLSPDQVLKITPNAIKEPVCFVWLDNTKHNRKTRYMNENRAYNFNEREEVEKQDSTAFIKSIYGFKNSHVLYFTNEEPERIAAVVYSAIKHPDLLDLYSKSFT